MPIGILHGLGAALMWGLTDVSATFGGRRLGSLRVLAVSQVVAFGVLAILALAQRITLPTDPRILVTTLVVGLAGTGAYLSFFTALRIGPLSVVSPITAAYGGLTVLLAVIFRGESLTASQAIGAGVATAGVVLAGIVFGGAGQRRPRLVGKGVFFALVALVLFAVMTVGMAGPIQEVGWLSATFVSRIANAVASVLLLVIALGVASRRFGPLLHAPLPALPRAWALAGLAGLLDVAGLISFAIGLEVAPTWQVGLASSFGPAVAVVVAVTFLGERLHRTQWAGLAGIGAGLMLVATG